MIRASSLAIAGVVLVSFIDNFSQFPVVAPYARALGAESGMVGAVVAIYSATNLAGNLLAGYALDRFGRKRMLVGGLMAAACAVLLYAAARAPLDLLLVRGAHGLAAAVLAPAAFTLLGDLFPSEQRGRAMGANGALIALAAMVAPATSGVIRDRWGFDGVFASVAALLVAAALLSLWLVQETHRPDPKDAPSPGALVALLRVRPLVLAYGSALALTFGLGTLVTYLPLRMEDLGFRASQIGFAFSAFALLAMIVMASPASRGGDLRGRFGSVGVGLLLVGLGLLLLGEFAWLWAILGAMAVFGLGFGLIFPAANALVADATRPGERGMAYGIFYAFYSAGVVAGASASGLLAAWPLSTVFGPYHLAALVALAAGAGILLSRARGGFEDGPRRR